MTGKHAADVPVPPVPVGLRLTRSEDPVIVWAFRLVSSRYEFDKSGEPVLVGLYEVKRLFSTDETRVYNNGTDRVETYLFVDAQRRVYHHRPGVEFGDPASYVRDGEAPNRLHFTDRPHGYARDVFGHVLTGDLPAVARVCPDQQEVTE